MLFYKTFKRIIGRLSNENTPWQPLRHTFLISNEHADTIHETGYTIAGKITDNELAKLKELYHSLHNFRHTGGGMFYSLYSRDISYRKRVHKEIQEVMQPIYDTMFKEYRCVINAFIVKVMGPESEFSLHQDSTGLDEMKYSALSVWIPLQDTDDKNGCLSVVPHSHKMFSPYRGISFPQRFESISSTVRKYLVPIKMKAGEILLFDNRLVHTSGTNNSNSDRVVVMSGIFPKNARIVSCYKDTNAQNSPIEIIEQEDDYLLTYESFFHNCTCRPTAGKLVNTVTWDLSQMTKKEFLNLCKKYNLRENNDYNRMTLSSKQTIIEEPAPLL